METSLLATTEYFVLDLLVSRDDCHRLYLCQAVPGEQHQISQVTGYWAFLLLPSRCQGADSWLHASGKTTGTTAGWELRRETCSAFALESISIQHNKIYANKSVKLLSPIQTKHNLVTCQQRIHSGELP